MARAVRKSGMRQVPLSAAKDDLSRLLRQAETQEVVITRHGVALCPTRSGPPRRHSLPAHRRPSLAPEC